MKEIIKELRAVLQPQGTSDLVRLDLGSAAYFEEEFIKTLIDTLESRLYLAGAGMDSFNPLEKLGAHVLLKSANIELRGG